MKLLSPPRPVAVSLAVSLFLPTLHVLAQSDAGALLNEQQRAQQRLPQRLPSDTTETQAPELKSADGVHVTLRSIRFSGATGLVSEAELQELVHDAIGRQLDFAGLQQLTARVTDHLHQKGYLLARAILPRQDLTEGVLEIRLLEGRLDSKNSTSIVPDTKNPPRIGEEHLQLILDTHLKAGEAVTESTLERTVLLIDDLPGLKAQAQLQAGQDPDSTRVAIKVGEGPEASGSISLDNYGNVDTGANELSINGQLNDPLRIGDQLTAGVTATDGLDLEHANYSLPLGSDGLKLSVALTHMDYRIIRGSSQSAGLNGDADSASITLSYPFIRSRTLNLYGALSYSDKRLIDNASVGQLDDKRDSSITATLSGDSLDDLGGGGLNNWSFGWTDGRLDLDANPANAATDAISYDTQGNFDKVNYSASRLQKLPGNFTLSASLSGQNTSKNLDSSEKFILGGPYGVRAYPVSEALGDNGWLASIEARYDLAPTTLGQWQLIGFYDTGHVTLHYDSDGIPTVTATGENSYTLSGWGLGANLTGNSVYSIHVGWAEKIGSNPGRTPAGLDADGTTDRSRFWLQAMLWM